MSKRKAVAGKSTKNCSKRSTIARPSIDRSVDDGIDPIDDTPSESSLSTSTTNSTSRANTCGSIDFKTATSIVNDWIFTERFSLHDGLLL